MRIHSLLVKAGSIVLALALMATSLVVLSPGAAAADATISGTVFDWNGSRVSNCMVVAYDMNGDQVGEGVYSVADGTYIYYGLQSGTQYKMLFACENGQAACGWYSDAGTFVQATAVLAPNTNKDVTLGRPSSISGKITCENTGEPLPDCIVDVYDSTEWIWLFNTVTDAAGEYSLNGLHKSVDYKIYYYPYDDFHRQEWYHDKTTYMKADSVGAPATDANQALGYLKPRIDSISPDSGKPGALITINGTYFADTRGSSHVKFGETRACDYVLWSNSQIQVLTPVCASGTVKLTVNTVGGTSNEMDFNVGPAAWYLAEGTSDWGFDSYVNIENPNAEQLHAKVTYMTKSGPVERPELTLPPLSQTTINPRQDLGATDFSTKVECTEGELIAVDRRMIWTGPGAVSPEGHSSIGVISPATTWYLPEGSSKWGFETWLLIQNPNDDEATCQVTYMLEGMPPQTMSKQVPANSRASFDIANDIGAADASVKVNADIPVIPERAMYRNNRREGHDSIGTTMPANDFYLAEGTSDWGFTTYVLIQNPNDSEVDVTLTYMTNEGPKEQEPFVMPAMSRKTVNVNQILPDMDFSTQVHGSLPIIAERAMYWGEGTPAGEACHDSIGMSSPHKTFYLPDGETYDGHETFALVQNPNDTPVEIEVSYLSSTGEGNVTFTDTIEAGARKTYNMSEKIPLGRASILVTSKIEGKNIMVERAMYWNNRGAGTCTIGGYSD
ncbi:MAG: IPT/TIG domain-containing protein [Actinobacteria bacterium]|nr:IPT/TIG domain-containing protein [Actinomycetota bacterium]MBU4401050.1 IPT/TIG domain-containing protein [Planctomycetota bacterium]MCG2818827.1 IPT/TIG domain-containing protein [Actinomycetes bacterium]MBU4179694.1 IPT/TIG domain-containing protein [Actinomycetota bacterium]MBU4219357.1 IPT/TIG domain-containing protein [Actinomycetota bacterium]